MHNLWFGFHCRRKHIRSFLIIQFIAHTVPRFWTKYFGIDMRTFKPLTNITDQKPSPTPIIFSRICLDLWQDPKTANNWYGIWSPNSKIQKSLHCQRVHDADAEVSSLYHIIQYFICQSNIEDHRIIPFLRVLRASSVSNNACAIGHICLLSLCFLRLLNFSLISWCNYVLSNSVSVFAVFAFTTVVFI